MCLMKLEKWRFTHYPFADGSRLTIKPHLTSEPSCPAMPALTLKLQAVDAAKLMIPFQVV